MKITRQVGNQVIRLGDSLTLKERHILSQVFLGLTNRAIAAQLNTSMYTVRNHLSMIYGKLGISNVRELFPLVITAQHELRTGRVA